MLVLLLLLQLGAAAEDNATRIHEAGYCMMYGKGDTSTINPSGGNYIKFNNIPAPDIDPTLKLLIGDLCPDLATTETACCDIGQFADLKSKTLQAKSLLSKCEVSWKNFISLFCTFTCSPDQSLYVNATKTNVSTIGEYENVVEVEMFLSEEYRSKYYNSIKDVSLPAANMKAIVALCGSSNCDEEKLFDFMGNNPLSPFPIRYLTEIPGSPDNGTAELLGADELLYCYEKSDEDSWLCSCQDCVSEFTCAAPPHIPAPKAPFLIAGFDGPLVILMIIYLSLFLICLLHLSINLHYRRRNQTDPLTRSASIASNISERHIAALQGHVNKGCRRVDEILHRLFTAWATFAIHHPCLVVIAAFIFVAAAGSGMYFFVMTSAPIDLWSAPTSRTRVEKNKFDDTFVPFYRTTQVIVTAPTTQPFNYTLRRDDVEANTTQTFGGVFGEDVFKKVFALQQSIMALTAQDGNTTIGVKDVCFIPLAPDIQECALISPFQWFQNNPDNVNKVTSDTKATYLDHVYKCVNSPLETFDGSFDSVSCLASFIGPAASNVALGGFHDTPDPLHATALVITIPLNNHVVESENKAAELWERVFIDFMLDYIANDSGILEIAFQAERSIQDELTREAQQDIFTVALSYMLMFGYVALMLGKVSCGAETTAHLYCLRRWFVDAKISLGLAGVLFVLLSVVCSLGIFSYAGFKSTVIVLEVIPFLVLAVGVDNIFILVQALQRDMRTPGESSDTQLIRIFGTIGPSMLLSAASEVIAFACGSLSTQPAVHDFSLYASVAVLINFLLQISVFLVLVAWDRRRELAERVDILCCVKASPEIALADGETRPRSPLYLLVSRVWVPALLNTTVVRFLVMSLFGLTFCLSIAAIPHLEIGLDQQVALPKDSYMGPYFDYISKYLEVGPPVYFVVEHEKGLDPSVLASQNQICGVSGCNLDSLVSVVNVYSNFSSFSRLAQPPNSWIDDYFDWLEPAGDDGSCCRYYNEGEENAGQFCPASDWAADCTACIAQGEYPHNRPTEEQFNKYLSWFLHDNPDLDTCTKGGHAAYGNAVNYTTDNTTGAVSSYTSSYFMSYHTTCRNSSDFITAYKQARNLSDLMEESVNATIYPYSVFYVYYEMYVTMVEQVAINLAVCIFAVFVVSFVLLNFNFMAAVITTTTVLMITVNMFGMMYLLDININPVSLVNLVMSVGISVEFCSHITRSFALSRHLSRVERAREALSKTGSSVLSGIFMTKLIGISVLAFAKSQIFEIYYFRMYVCIVALGMLHGLVFLPVFLTFFGPARNTKPVGTSGFGKIEEEERNNSERTPLLL